MSCAVVSSGQAYGFGSTSSPPSAVRPRSHTEASGSSPMTKFGFLTRRTWPSVVTTWLQDGIFVVPLDWPYLGFWRHALDCSMTACLLPGSGSVFRFCLSGAAVCMTAHCATHSNESFPSDFVVWPGMQVGFFQCENYARDVLQLLSERPRLHPVLCEASESVPDKVLHTSSSFCFFRQFQSQAKMTHKLFAKTWSSDCSPRSTTDSCYDKVSCATPSS